MHSVKVKRLELLEKLKTNLESHRDQFLKAQDGYRAIVIEELDGMLRDAREGRKIITHVALPAPQDHTAAYQNAIAMLEMSVDETIEIDHHQFRQFVLDDWDWKMAAETVNAAYSVGQRP